MVILKISCPQKSKMATISIKNNHAAAPYSNHRRFYTTIDLFLNTFYALFHINLLCPLHTLHIRLAHPFIIFHTKLCLLSTAPQPPSSQRIFVYSPALLTTIAAHIPKDYFLCHFLFLGGRISSVLQK